MDSSFSPVLLCPLRLECFLRVVRSIAPLCVLLLFWLFGRSIFSVTLTVFLPSVSSSDDGSYDLLDTSRSSCSSLLACEMVRYFGLEEDTRLLTIGADVVLLLRLLILDLRMLFCVFWVRIFFWLSTGFVLLIVFLLYNNNNFYVYNNIKL